MKRVKLLYEVEILGEKVELKLEQILELTDQEDVFCPRTSHSVLTVEVLCVGWVSFKKIVLFGPKFYNFRSPTLRLTTAKAYICGASLGVF